jgi:hypothetical protein
LLIRPSRILLVNLFDLPNYNFSDTTVRLCCEVINVRARGYTILGDDRSAVSLLGDSSAPSIRKAGTLMGDRNGHALRLGLDD